MDELLVEKAKDFGWEIVFEGGLYFPGAEIQYIPTRMNSPDLELGMISLDNKTEYSLVCPGCGLGKTIVEVYNNYEQNHYPGVLDGVLFHLKQKGSKGKLRLPDFLKEEVNENHALFNPELNQPHYKGGVLYLVGNVEDIMGAVDSMLIPLDIN